MNLHLIVSDFIPIIVIYHDRLALKLQFSDRSLTLYRLVLAFAGAAGQLKTNSKLTTALTKNDRILQPQFFFQNISCCQSLDATMSSLVLARFFDVIAHVIFLTFIL